MKYQVKLTFTEELLGAVALDKDIYVRWPGDKAPSPEALDEELETICESPDKGVTGFHRVDGKPILYDYVLKGFFKDACSMLRRVPDTRSAKLTSFKKVIDGLVFVTPRRIPIHLSGEITFNTRPLRAQTAQGERIALARSETAPAGSSIEFTINVLGGVVEQQLKEWLDYGELRGLGQWRNASWGRFSYELTKLT